MATHDADRRDDEGVGEADGERPQVAVGRAVAQEERFADLEARLALRKEKPLAMRRCLEVGGGVRYEKPEPPPRLPASASA